jgi:acyl carrier protein
MAAQAAPQGESNANKLRRLIADYLGIEAEQVTDEAHFADDLGIDWLDQLELMIMIEDEFIGVELSETTVIEVVGDLIRHIEMKAASLNNLQNAAATFRKSAA